MDHTDVLWTVMMDFVTDFGSVLITFNLQFFINYLPSFFSPDILITNANLLGSFYHEHVCIPYIVFKKDIACHMLCINLSHLLNM